MLNHLILYCRSGFESECAQEIQDKANELGVYGFPKTKPNTAYVIFQTYEDGGATDIISQLNFEELIFARQWFAANPMLTELPPEDRATPICETAQAISAAIEADFSYVEVEAADTNEAKELLKFCRKFTSPLVRTLEKAHCLSNRKTDPTLHVFLMDSSCGYVGVSFADNRSPWFMGVPRLKFPKEAPSRSTLKLEEAWHHFLSPRDQEKYLQPGMRGVDLGAAPGGWTWQLVKRHIHVYAVDNGPMNEDLMESGLVDHIREDGFLYWPQKSVDWLVCDMVEKPIRVAHLMAKWLATGKAKHIVFNLKLPMKKRYPELQKCFAAIDESMEGQAYRLNTKQLYHDREEVTCYLRLVD